MVNIKFSEYQPNSLLRVFVQNYWIGEFNIYSENNFVQSVVPNGCIELIIHLTTDHCELLKHDIWEQSPEFTLIGLQTTKYEVKFNAMVKVFGIRFKPEGVYNFFGVQPAQFTSTFENSKDVLGVDFDDYCSRLRESKSIPDQINLTEKFLVRKLETHFVGKMDYVKMASSIIRKNQGILSLNSLIKQVPIGTRQLQREFKSKLGITAKEYMRLIRLNTIQNYMQDYPNTKLTELTYEQGFSDQAHFSREFKILTGVNPKQFLKNRDEFIVNLIKREV